TPPTSNTTMRSLWLTASRNDPGPESSRLVTCTTDPPRPPEVVRPKPSAQGKARGPLGSGGHACALFEVPPTPELSPPAPGSAPPPPLKLPPVAGSPPPPDRPPEDS